MKKMLIAAGAILLTTVFSACSGDNKEEAKADVNEFSNYVDSVNSLKPVYTEVQWTSIDEGYKPKADKVDKVSAALDDADKTKVESSKKKYSDLKDKYEAGIKAENEKATARQELRDKLFGPGRITAENKWDFVTPANVVSVYKDFVDRVRDNGTNYSDDDWAEVKSLWAGLNDRKEVIDKDMSTGDRAKVTGIKIAYIGIKSINKPISDIKEDAKNEN